MTRYGLLTASGEVLTTGESYDLLRRQLESGTTRAAYLSRQDGERWTHLRIADAQVYRMQVERAVAEGRTIPEKRGPVPSAPRAPRDPSGRTRQGPRVSRRRLVEGPSVCVCGCGASLEGKRHGVRFASVLCNQRHRKGREPLPPSTHCQRPECGEPLTPREDQRPQRYHPECAKIVERARKAAKGREQRAQGRTP